MKLFLRFLRYVKLIHLINFKINTKVGDRHYKIPLMGGIGLTHRLKLSEEWMLHILQLLINEMGFNKLFVDVGANIGQTLLKVNSMSNNIKYIGIEPNPVCVSYLQHLINENELTHFDIWPVGIDSECSLKELHLSGNTFIGSSATILYKFRNDTITKTMTIPVINNKQIDINEKISILKIDVEGAELEVIQEFYQYIKKDLPVIIIEILPNYGGELKERAERQKKIEELISSLNYNIYRIHKEKGRFSGITKIEEFGNHSNIELSDYILVHESISGRIELVFKM